MPRYGNPHQISRVHIADGFEDDCDELIQRFTQLNTFNYMSFCNLWKDMNFGYVYQGRTIGAEVAELSEEVIHIAKHYMVKNTSNFEESVAGLFILYGLLNLQPYTSFARVRIVPKDVPAINRIELVARRERRFDVLYILGSVLVRWSEFHAAEREHGMEPALRKYLEGYTSIDKLGVRPKGVFYRQNEELDIIRELGSVTRQYVRAKTCLTGNTPDPSLQYINEALPVELNSSLKLIINGIVEERSTNVNEDAESEPEHYDAVQSIKHKAMMNVVDPMRHLTGVGDRKKKKSASPKKNADMNEPSVSTSKTRTSSPMKSTAGSPKKGRRTKCSPRKKSPEVPVNKTIYDSDSEVDLDLEEFQKEAAEGNEHVEVIVEDMADPNIEELDVQIDTLPVIIATGDEGQSYEIEIIDEYQGGSNIIASDTSQDTDPFGTKIDIISDTYKGLPGNKSFGRPRKRVKNSGIATLLQKRERRDTKRGRIKTFFKKMGMSAVANFNENSDDKHQRDDGHKSDDRHSDDGHSSDDSRKSDDS